MAETILHDQIERVAKTLPVALAALYVAGFIIVAFRLARYGASSLELFRIQYVAAGFWFGIASSLFLLLSAAMRPVVGQYLFQTVKYTFKRKFLQGNEEIDLLGALTTNCFLVLLLAGISFISKEIRNQLGESHQTPPLVEFALAVASIDVFLRAWLLFKSKQSEGVLWAYGARLGVLFLSLLVMVSLLVFSKDIYPTLPFSIGGGQTRQVMFWLGPQSASTSTFLERDGSSEYTISYDLLLENETSYVVASPKDSQRSIEFDRKAVGAMIVLRKQPSAAK